MHPTNGDPGGRRGGGPKPLGLLVRLAYQSLGDFKLRFAPNLSRGGVFIRTREPRPVGTAVAFELRLASGEKALRGDGVVRSVESEDLSSTPPRLPGMAIQFTRLDATSRALVEAMVGSREAGSRTPPTSSRPALTPLSTFEIPLPVAPVPISRPSSAIIGIDLGTTNACAAVVRDGRPYLIPSREGYRTIPSTVALTSRQTLVVGHLARAQLLTHPAGTIHGAKRLLGRSFDSAVTEEMRGRYPYEIVPDANGLAAVRLGTLTVTIEQLAALVLREVKELAQNHLGEEVNRAVLTVPAYYNDRQRQAIRHAAGLAGLRVERILSEPTAAALAYAWGRHLQQRVLVYDLGGATFDASVLELQDNQYEVVSTGGDHFLGGVDFDERITASLLREYAQQVGAEFDGEPVARSRLGDAAERAKCALSERASYPLQLPFLALHEGKPVTFEALLTRAELEKLVEPLVDRTIEVCREALRAKGLSVQDIDEVILVGGQSRMPLVHQKVAAFFCKAPTRAVQPDEAVALGAALLAQSLEGAEDRDV